jgi:hypothetical protein
LSAADRQEAEIVKANTKALVKQLIESGRYEGMDEQQALEAMKNDVVAQMDEKPAPASASAPI